MEFFAFEKENCSFDNWGLSGEVAIVPKVFLNAENIVKAYSIDPNKVKANPRGVGMLELEWDTIHGTLTFEVAEDKYTAYLADYNHKPFKQLFCYTVKIGY